MESKLPNAALSSPSFEFSSCNDPELALRTASQDVSMTTPGGGWWGDAPAQDRENGNDNDGVDGTSRSSTQSGNINQFDILLVEDVHVVVDDGVDGTSSSVHFYLPTTIERTRGLPQKEGIKAMPPDANLSSVPSKDDEDDKVSNGGGSFVAFLSYLSGGCAPPHLYAANDGDFSPPSSLRRDPTQDGGNSRDDGVDGTLSPSRPDVNNHEVILPETSSTMIGTDGRSYTEAHSCIVASVLATKAAGGRWAHYRVLGISDYKADDAEIKRTYRQMALKLHPDKNSAPRADEAFKAVGNAYEMLSDQQKRRVYDMTGEEILNGRHQQAAEAEQHPQTAEDIPYGQICCFFCLYMFFFIGISASIGVICSYSPSVGLILLICWFGCIGCLPILGTN